LHKLVLAEQGKTAIGYIEHLMLNCHSIDGQPNEITYTARYIQQEGGIDYFS